METVIVKSKYEIERAKPMPSLNHGIVQANIIGLFFLHYRTVFRVVSELSTKLDDQKRVPDIAIYARENMAVHFKPRADQISTTEPPLCVVEILSPTQSFSELVVKSARYFENKVQSYWLVLPEVQTIYVFSEVDEYEVFVKKGKMLDAKLDVSLDLEAIFS